MPEAKTPGQMGAPEYKCPEAERSQEWLGSAASIPGIHQGRNPHLYRLDTGGRGIHTKKYPRPKIKEAMFTSLEGKAKRNYQACDEKGDLSSEKILEKMDMIYRTSISFQDLNTKLCGLKQGDWESPKEYYEQMVDISVALKQYHGDRFQPGELARMKKQCFFTRLRENYKYLVCHLKDQDDVDLVLMLKEIWECNES